MDDANLAAFGARRCAELVLYDGPVNRPEELRELVADERVSVFGTSPSYLRLCQDSGFSPGSLPELRTVLSTGSILHDWQYDWVQEDVESVGLQSTSGGTDIIGCSCSAALTCLSAAA